MFGRKAKYPVHECEANTTQHPFAEPALVCIDVELEEPVYQHQNQECCAQGHKRLLAIEIYAAENFRTPDQWKVVDNSEKRLSRIQCFKAVTLNWAIDDLLRQVEGQKIRYHGCRHDEQDPKLLPAGMAPDVAEQAPFHRIDLFETMVVTTEGQIDTGCRPGSGA
ncbi:hypothetical protein D3C80_726270 [compost metagenome]